MTTQTATRRGSDWLPSWDPETNWESRRAWTTLWVTTFTLTYYDRDNAVIASPSAAISSIRSIQLTVTATKASISETLRSRVFLRSLSRGSGAS